jgi:hypothetical protein
VIPLAKAKPRRRNETRDLLRPILAILNRMPGVRVVRNHNVGAVVPYHRRLEPNPPRFVAGLGLGSADLVGIVRMPAHSYSCPCPACDGTHYELGCGRTFCLEVKLPSVDGRRGELRPDQKRWLAQVRQLGGFACVVRSVDEAVAAVERCRCGESE